MPAFLLTLDVSYGIRIASYYHQANAPPQPAWQKNK